MKVLHVIPSTDPRLGGVAQAVRSLVAGLAAEGVASEVASLDAPDAPWHQADAFVVHGLGPGRGPWQHSARLRPWLLAHLARFDAVVLHGLWLYHGYALHKTLQTLEIQHKKQGKTPLPRLFVMPHGMLDPYFQRAADRRLKALRNQLYWHLIERRVLNQAHGVLFTCETERELARQPFGGYRPRRETVVGLGVEAPPPLVPAMPAAFLQQCPTLRGRPYLLFLSRIHEKKGADLLLEAYAQLLAAAAAAGQSLAALPALVVAGPGLDSAYGQALAARAAALPAPAQVLFPGMLAGAAKWGAFYGAEAFVLPSHQENFGIAVVEALACGTPVLISDQVNIWREIEAGGGGLVAPDTVAGTLHLLRTWSQLAPAEKQALGQGAQAMYARQFAIAPAARNFRRGIAE